MGRGSRPAAKRRPKPQRRRQRAAQRDLQAHEEEGRREALGSRASHESVDMSGGRGLSAHLPSASYPEVPEAFADRGRSQTQLSGATNGSHPPLSGASNRSASNSRHSGSEHLPNVILHYLPGIDAEDNTGLLASQYYGNMSFPGTADRRPRPMNSTLPLFSPSVIHGRIRGRSSRGSDGSSQQLHSSRQRLTSISVDVASAPSSIAGSGSGKESAGPPPSSTFSRDGATPRATGAFPQPIEPVAAAEPHDDAAGSPAELPHTDMAGREDQPAGEGSTSDSRQKTEATLAMEPGSPEAQPESTGSCVYEADNEKAEGLGLQTESRPSSQARARRLKHAGATQYTPATLSKKSTIARAAPGLSYMFSPPVGGSGPASGSSRPPSVMGSITGGAMPAAHPPLHYTQTQQVPPLRPQALGEVQRTLSQEDMGAEDIRHTGTRRSSSGSQQQQPTSDTTPRGERKMYGSINVGALELFLEDGKVPDTSSDEECSGFSNDDFGWEENYSASGASSVYRNSLGRDPRPMSALQDQIRKHSSLDERDFGTASPQRQSPGLRANQFSPRIRSYGRSGTPDEHMPLLNQHQPPSYGTEPVEFIVPADMQGPLGAPSLQQGRQQRRRKSRRRQNHENLFLDKDGFIDESYRFTFFNPALGTIRAQEFADLRTPTMDLAALLQAGGCFWIDVLRPSFQEMHLLSKIFGIHALTVEDIMTQDSREKCEIHAHYYFVCFRSFDNDPSSETYLEPKCIYNIVLREGIITFHMDPSVHQYHVLRRIRRQIDHIVVTPDWLNYAIIDEITDLLAPVWHSIEFDVDAIDELVLVISSSEQSDMLLRISTVRKRIMMATRLLQGKPDVVRALIKRFESATAFNTTQMNAIAGSVPMPVVDRQPGSTAWSSESPQIRAAAIPNDSVAIDMAMDQRKGQETLLYLGDVLDHIVTMMQNATHYDNMLGRAQSNYLAQVSVELTRSSDYTNDVVAKLSALAAVVMPLQICSGLWGMNVKVPGQDRDDLWDFFIILGLLLAYVGIAVTWARRRGIF